MVWGKVQLALANFGPWKIPKLKGAEGACVCVCVQVEEQQSVRLCLSECSYILVVCFSLL